MAGFEVSTEDEDHANTLDARFTGAHAPHDLGASKQITLWAYAQVERSKGRVWIAGRTLRPLGLEWRQVLA